MVNYRLLLYTKTNLALY